MRNTGLKILALGMILVSLGACAGSHPALTGQLDSQFSHAVKTNIAAHAVAPTARQKANTYIPADPSRVALARKNYLDNDVPNPKHVGP